MDIITQNLANVDTIGYKKGKISFIDYLIPQDLTNTTADLKIMNFHTSPLVDYSEGNLVKTSNPLDIALDGEGFIALENNLYTRRGDLRKDNKGYLTNHNGIKVLGERGPIMLPEGKIEITPTGLILVNNIAVDVLRVVKFKDPKNVSKIGDSLFYSNDESQRSNTLIKQGYLETSNVNVITEMVKMISTLREYEAYQKAIQTFDESAAKVNNEMGRL